MLQAMKLSLQLDFPRRQMGYELRVMGYASGLEIPPIRGVVSYKI